MDDHLLEHIPRDEEPTEQDVRPTDFTIFKKLDYGYDRAETVQFAALRVHGNMFFLIVFVIMSQLIFRIYLEKDSSARYC